MCPERYRPWPSVRQQSNSQTDNTRASPGYLGLVPLLRSTGVGVRIGSLSLSPEFVRSNKHPIPSHPVLPKTVDRSPFTETNGRASTPASSCRALRTPPPRVAPCRAHRLLPPLMKSMKAKTKPFSSTNGRQANTYRAKRRRRRVHRSPLSPRRRLADPPKRRRCSACRPSRRRRRRRCRRRRQSGRASLEHLPRPLPPLVRLDRLCLAFLGKRRCQLWVRVGACRRGEKGSKRARRTCYTCGAIDVRVIAAGSGSASCPRTVCPTTCREQNTPG